MDSAVALVRTYLQANGYFTVTEYPILEGISEDNPRTVTDVDVLAIRFPGAGGYDTPTETGGLQIAPDPRLDPSEEMIDVIIGEVKEGAAILNEAAVQPEVLAAVLRRFGHLDDDVCEAVVAEIIKEGRAIRPGGIRVRLVVFASKPPNISNPIFEWVSLGSIAQWMADQVQRHWNVLKSIQSKDPVLGFMILFEKAIRGES